jgi:hypothetical protein
VQLGLVAIMLFAVLLITRQIVRQANAIVAALRNVPRNWSEILMMIAGLIVMALVVGGASFFMVDPVLRTFEPLPPFVLG